MMSFVAKKRIGAAEIATQIRQLISADSVRQYERLPSERQLSETYGTSRGTVREALLRLEKEGLVDIRPGSGTYVLHNKQPTGQDIIRHASPLELVDARFALEPHICRLAVLHGQPADFIQLEKHLTVMEKSVFDPQQFSLADSQFHVDLVKSTNNSLLIWIISQINAVRANKHWSKMLHATLSSEMIETYNRQHRMILEGLRQRDPEHAATLMKEHLQTARESLTSALGI